MYVIYNETGVITATIVGPDETYGPNVLDKNHQKWIFLKSTSSLDPRTTYIDVATRQVVQAAPIQLAVDKASFKADGNDAVKITGIPLHASVAVFCNGAIQTQQTMVDDHLEITAAAPAEYRIDVSCLHYLPASVTIEATA